MQVFKWLAWVRVVGKTVLSTDGHVNVDASQLVAVAVCCSYLPHIPPLQARKITLIVKVMVRLYILAAKCRHFSECVGP